MTSNACIRSGLRGRSGLTGTGFMDCRASSGWFAQLGGAMNKWARSICKHVRQAWTVPADDAVAASVVKDIKDMHKTFQTFLGFFFAATFAATVALQGKIAAAAASGLTATTTA
ncbi:g2638 [Coccomyxa viridis]|uniref:G2638 protein n=1 Tax=Coccomyxa viridis TaxID=1274662 RepID=A0ABP1FRA9_9CHLO